MKTILNDLIAEQSVVDNLINSLSEKQWEEQLRTNIRVRDIPGNWTIKDEVVHIAFFDFVAAALMMGEADQALELMPLGTTNEYSQFPLQRVMSKDKILAWWREMRTKMDFSFYSNDSKTRIQWAPLPSQPMSAKSLATARLMELWAHSVDICDHFGLEIKIWDRISHTLFLSWLASPFAYRINGLSMSETPLYLQLTLPSGEIWDRGEKNDLNYIKGNALDWALVAIRRRNWLDTDLEVVGEEAKRFASVVQTFAGDANQAPISKNNLLKE